MLRYPSHFVLSPLPLLLTHRSALQRPPTKRAVKSGRVVPCLPPHRPFALDAPVIPLQDRRHMKSTTRRSARSQSVRTLSRRALSCGGGAQVCGVKLHVAASSPITPFAFRWPVNAVDCCGAVRPLGRAREQQAERGGPNAAAQKVSCVIFLLLSVSLPVPWHD